MKPKAKPRALNVRNVPDALMVMLRKEAAAHKLTVRALCIGKLSMPWSHFKTAQRQTAAVANLTAHCIHGTPITDECAQCVQTWANSAAYLGERCGNCGKTRVGHLWHENYWWCDYTARTKFQDGAIYVETPSGPGAHDDAAQAAAMAHASLGLSPMSMPKHAKQPRTATGAVAEAGNPMLERARQDAATIGNFDELEKEIGEYAAAEVMEDVMELERGQHNEMGRDEDRHAVDDENGVQIAREAGRPVGDQPLGAGRGNAASGVESSDQSDSGGVESNLGGGTVAETDERNPTSDPDVDQEVSDAETGESVKGDASGQAEGSAPERVQPRDPEGGEGGAGVVERREDDQRSTVPNGARGSGDSEAHQAADYAEMMTQVVLTIDSELRKMNPEASDEGQISAGDAAGAIGSGGGETGQAAREDPEKSEQSHAPEDGVPAPAPGDRESQENGPEKNSETPAHALQGYETYIIKDDEIAPGLTGTPVNTEPYKPKPSSCVFVYTGPGGIDPQTAEEAEAGRKAEGLPEFAGTPAIPQVPQEAFDFLDKLQADQQALCGADPAFNPYDCPDCRAAMKHAYSDATTPGFFYDRCEKHRKPPASVNPVNEKSLGYQLPEGTESHPIFNDQAQVEAVIDTKRHVTDPEPTIAKPTHKTCWCKNPMKVKDENTFRCSMCGREEPR